MPSEDYFSQLPNSNELNRDELFGSFSSQLTKKYESDLKNLFETIDPILKEKGDGCTLCVITQTRSHSGETQPIQGLVGLNERLFSKETPRSIQEAILTHELVHASLGRKLRETAEKDFPEIFNFYNENIIGEWIKNNVPVVRIPEGEVNEQQKMLGGSMSPQMNFDKVKQVFSDGLLQLQKGTTINNFDKSLQLSNLNVFKSGREVMANKKTLPFTELVETNPSIRNHTAALFLIGEKLHYNSREVVSNRIHADLWEYEEGYANAIMERLTGTSVDELQKFAPQDLGKIQLAKKFLEIIKTPDDARECIRTITDYDEFGSFVKDKLL